MAKLRRPLRAAILLIEALFLLLSASLFVMQFFGYRMYCIESGSMEPFLRVRDAALVDCNVPFQELNEGDVIVYDRNGTNVIHRVTGTSDGGLILKGDANPAADRTLVTERIYVGRLLMRLPGAGHVLDGLKQPAVAGLLAVLLTGGFFVAMFLEPEDSQTRDEKNQGPEGPD